MAGGKSDPSTPPNMIPRHSSDDVLSILVASDVHLGYAEKDPIREHDSFNSFEEVLAIANERQVDMVLLAGDLFHDNKPSRKTLMRCMQLLRDYCLGGREVKMEVVSDPAKFFHNKCAAQPRPFPSLSCFSVGPSIACLFLP